MQIKRFAVVVVVTQCGNRWRDYTYRCRRITRLENVLFDIVLKKLFCRNLRKTCKNKYISCGSWDNIKQTLSWVCLLKAKSQKKRIYIDGNFVSALWRIKPVAQSFDELLTDLKRLRDLLSRASKMLDKKSN